MSLAVIIGTPELALATPQGADDGSHLTLDLRAVAHRRYMEHQKRLAAMAAARERRNGG